MAARDVEISIVNHENRDMVRTCLRSLPEACAGLTWHVSVIDNVSRDGSLEMLAREFPAVEVLANQTRRGFGANHNQVLRRLLVDGSARYVLVLNDDTELKPQSVSLMVEDLDRRTDLGAIVPQVVDQHGRPAVSRLAFPTARNALHCDRTDITEGPDPDGGWLQGCCLLLRLDALRDVGPFDERFFLFYEDVDLSRSLLQGGWSLGVCSAARVVHHGHATVLRDDMARLTPKQGLRSRYLYFTKHRGRMPAELISLAGRTILLARGVKAAAGAARHRDRARYLRARTLLALARFNPRRPLPMERSAVAGSALVPGPVTAPAEPRR
jgi:N-acetylglucosaminyl-diphospho-decaprenol L-rhamnosyltransferase